MIAADWMRAALHALLAALILAGAVHVWEIAAIEAAFGLAQAFFQPAYSGCHVRAAGGEGAGKGARGRGGSGAGACGAAFGLAGVRSRTWVWVTIAAFTGAVFCVYAPWYALAPGIARSVYGGVGVFGLLEAAMGVGAVCGGLAGLAWRPARPLRAGLVLVLVWPVQTASFALGAPLALMVLLTFSSGVGWRF